MTPGTPSGRGGVNVGHVLVQRARLGPNRLAITFEQTSLTYADLNARVNRLANGLAGLGVGRGDRVAVLLSNCHEYYEVLFACAKLGAVLVTVNYRLVADEVRHVLEDAEPGVFIYGDEFREVADAARLTAPAVVPVILERAGSPAGLTYAQLLEAPSSEPDRVVGLDDPLIIMYTSGTTGRPKGVVLSHGNVLWTSFNQIADWGLRTEDRCLVVAPLYHVGGLLVLTFPCLHLGGAVYIHGSYEPGNVLDAIAAHGITTLFLAPTMWNMLLQQPDIDNQDLSSVRLCCSGGEALPVAVMERLTALFGEVFTDGYGLTEASSCSTVLRPEHVITKRGSVGVPLLHNALRVVDPDGADVAVGERGEVIQSGPTVMQGYWRRPEATADALRNGWLHTGDVGRFDEDGFLWIVDRKKDMIISGAENVYPAEIEQVLYRHPSILEVAVIGLPDERWGEAVTAVVALRAGVTDTEAGIADYCRGKMAGYKRPRRVIFIDALPRNPSGKVLKRVLRERFATHGDPVRPGSELDQIARSSVAHKT
jgi:fatty-acyl-CoA synthase